MNYNTIYFNSNADFCCGNLGEENVVPASNVEQHIRQCIEERIENTLEKFEVYGLGLTMTGERRSKGSGYLIPEADWGLQDLMKHHFNTHAEIPTAKQAAKAVEYFKSLGKPWKIHEIINLAVKTR